MLKKLKSLNTNPPCFKCQHWRTGSEESENEKNGERGQSRTTYAGAAQSLHGAKVEREGQAEGKKVEEEERQHIVRPSEDNNERKSWDRLLTRRKGRTEMKKGDRETDRTTNGTCLLKPAISLHHMSHSKPFNTTKMCSVNQSLRPMEFTESNSYSDTVSGLTGRVNM